MLKKIGKLTTIKKKTSDPKVPPGQYATEKFPVLTFGNSQTVDTKDWSLEISGLVQNQLTLDWNQFTDLEKITVNSPFHCVTQWSRMENKWEGVSFKKLVQLAKPKPEAKYVMIHCYGEYTTNLSVDILIDTDVLLAYRHDDAPLPAEHGGPVRLVVPKLYGWKSAKWIKGLEFLSENSPGFWEKRGYHMDGDPWKEQRFTEDD